MPDNTGSDFLRALAAVASGGLTEAYTGITGAATGQDTGDQFWHGFVTPAMDGSGSRDFQERYLNSQINNPANTPGGSTPIPVGIRGADYWQNIAQQGANAPPRVNPYNTQAADQSRGAQLALMQQMQAQRAGPSIAAMQAGGAQGQNVQAALAAGRGGGVGRMASQAAGGMGSAAGQAVLAEQMRAQQGLGGVAGGLRGRDIQSAQNQGQSGLQARSLDDAARQFYASQGAMLHQKQAQAQLEALKLRERLRQKYDKGNADITEKTLNGIGSFATTAAGMG